jgi:hypothetical protein
LHNYLRGSKDRPKWYGEFWNCRSNLTKIPKELGSAH